MSVIGTATVACPNCGRQQDARLVQSINARTAAEVKAQLLAGDLNVLVCVACGARTQLAATVLFVDPDADYTAQVVPGDDPAVAHAIALMAAAGVMGTRRVVPSLNALVEKVKLLDAGLADWAIEMTKVLLLATLADQDLDRVMLFDHVDRGAQRIHWVRFDGPGAPVPVASPLAAYERLLGRPGVQPPRSEARIDRAWAVGAVQAMISNVN